MTAAPLAAAVAEARSTVMAIDTLARVADRVGAGMNIPRGMGRERGERAQLCALARCIVSLAELLGARLDEIDPNGTEHHGD
jgi:hypothetical protein